MNKIDIVLNDYNQKKNSFFKHLSFLDPYSKSKVYVTKSGLICHKVSTNTEISLDLWEKKIFSKKIETTKRLYSANNPVMLGRHYYAANFINEFVKKKDILCDFGTGEGTFINEIIRVNPKVKICFTEHSKKNYRKVYQKISKKNFFIKSFNSSIESADFKNEINLATLNWTLCNCIDPLNVLKNIHKSLKKNGKLLISESSRVLVPFKKPINNFFNKNLKTENSHPWFFSYNSLSNILEVSGFRIIKKNRFFDENDLVVVAEKQNMKYFKPKIKFDNLKKTEKFFKDWCFFTKKYNF